MVDGVEEEEECWSLATISRNAKDLASKDSTSNQQEVYYLVA